MILKDFLSWQKYTKGNPHRIIPISFNMQNVLQTRYYNIGDREQGKYLVQTRSETKTSGIISPMVHGINKGIDPNIRLEVVIRLVVTPEGKRYVSHWTKNRSR